MRSRLKAVSRGLLGHQWVAGLRRGDAARAADTLLALLARHHVQLQLSGPRGRGPRSAKSQEESERNRWVEGNGEHDIQGTDHSQRAGRFAPKNEGTNEL